jgi:hypothetical protein
MTTFKKIFLHIANSVSQTFWFLLLCSFIATVSLPWHFIPFYMKY